MHHNHAFNYRKTPLLETVSYPEMRPTRQPGHRDRRGDGGGEMTGWRFNFQ
jgi:hypothetical protein